jgi:hypothetical protein
VALRHLRGVREAEEQPTAVAVLRRYFSTPREAASVAYARVLEGVAVDDGEVEAVEVSHYHAAGGVGV